MTAPFGPCAGQTFATQLRALERATKATPKGRRIGAHPCNHGHWHADCDCPSIVARIVRAVTGMAR